MHTRVRNSSWALVAAAVTLSCDWRKDERAQNYALLEAAVASIAEVHDARFPPDSTPLVHAHWLITKTRNAQDNLKSWSTESSPVRKVLVEDLSSILRKLEQSGVAFADAINSGSENSLAETAVNLEDGRQRLQYVFLRVDTLRFRLNPKDTVAISRRLADLTASIRDKDVERLGMKDGLSQEWFALMLLHMRLKSFARAN